MNFKMDAINKIAWYFVFTIYQNCELWWLNATEIYNRYKALIGWVI